MKNIKHSIQSSGQALLIVLLVMSVVLTVVLSTVSRSVSDVAITGLEENALRAFSAAEAGVEQSLLDQTVGTFGPVAVDSGDSSVSYTRVVSEPTEPTGRFEYPKEIVSGETASFWLVSHAANAGRLTCPGGSTPCFVASAASQLRFCWGNGAVENADVSKRPAIEVMFYYDDSNPVGSVASTNNFSSVKVARVTFDPVSSRPTGNNSFGTQVNSGNCQIGTRNFTYRSGLAVPPSVYNACSGRPGCMLMAKVRTYYNSTPIPVGIVTESGNSIAAQGFRIESTGVAGDATRQVNVVQVYPEIPDIFDAAIFSLRNITK